MIYFSAEFHANSTFAFTANIPCPFMEFYVMLVYNFDTRNFLEVFVTNIFHYFNNVLKI